jgi:hypothetical protein
LHEVGTVFKSVSDITEAKRLEAQLRQARAETKKPKKKATP